MNRLIELVDEICDDAVRSAVENGYKFQGVDEYKKIQALADEWERMQKEHDELLEALKNVVMAVDFRPSHRIFLDETRYYKKLIKKCEETPLPNPPTNKGKS